jgi:hypothetical protein
VGLAGARDHAQIGMERFRCGGAATSPRVRQDQQQASLRTIPTIGSNDPCSSPPREPVWHVTRSGAFAENIRDQLENDFVARLGQLPNPPKCISWCVESGAGGGLR